VLEELDKKPGEVELPELVEDLELSGYLGALDVTALAKKKFTEDDAAPNGSSIVLLAEYDRHKVLLCGDAFPSDVAGAVQRLTGSERLKVSAIKAPHHGSRRNNSNALYSAISAEHFLISTNGARFKHPDLEGIARMLLNNKPEGRTTLHFNYRSPFNTVWDAAEIRNDWMYDTNYPSEGITVNL
jgi:beta-lactamase superfamily II metal-dependent hydrolase